MAERLGVPESRLEVIYYGCDPARYAQVGADERRSARRAIGGGDRPLVGFVGALGDRRKGFDTLFAAWQDLCARRDWDADLVVVGGGAELPRWQKRARAAGLDRRMIFLGFRTDVPAILAALDLLVHPARYEAYGLSVHEAICRGVPAIVSASAGVAEKYTPALGDLLLQDPGNAGELVDRFRAWRQDAEAFRTRVATLATELRARTWDHMAAQMVSCIERSA